MSTPDPASADGSESDGATDPTPAPRRRRWTTLLAVAGGLVLGLGAAVVGAEVFGGGEDDAAPAAARTVVGAVDSPDDLLPDDVPVPPGAGAASAEAALEGFLVAEVQGDLTTSFGFLSDAGRAAFGSPAGWVSAHADVLPRILDFELGERTDIEDGRAALQATLVLEPNLDPVTGLTPAEAVVTWDLLRGDDGWGVSIESSPFEPVYPDDAGAGPAAESWAADRQRCETPANEHGLLVGSPALADTLCDTTGAVTVGPPTPLDEARGQPLFTAFGPEAMHAARAVRLSGPADLTVVLVPVGERWTVVGILP